MSTQQSLPLQPAAPPDATSADAAGGASAGGSTHAGTADADHYRRLMDRLFSMLSHDLRTPLSAISGWLFLLESDKLDAAGKKRALDKIRANLDEEVRLIDDTLLLSRCKAGTISLEQAPVAVRAIVRSAIESMQGPAAAKGAAIRSTLVDSAPEALVFADTARLKRAFELLLDHALRSVGGKDGMINIAAARRDDGTIEITIADNGRGMAAAALPHLFDPFGQPPDPASGTRQSNDRALLIAAALIEAHGGKLGAHSAGEGLGATCTVTLPPSPPAAAA